MNLDAVLMTMLNFLDNQTNQLDSRGPVSSLVSAQRHLLQSRLAPRIKVWIRLDAEKVPFHPVRPETFSEVRKHLRLACLFNLPTTFTVWSHCFSLFGVNVGYFCIDVCYQCLKKDNFLKLRISQKRNMLCPLVKVKVCLGFQKVYFGILCNLSWSSFKQTSRFSHCNNNWPSENVT